MVTPNYNDPRDSTNAFSIGQQELLRLKNRIKFIEEAFENGDTIGTVPTKLSELENDVGFITAEDIPEGPGGTIPTKTSDLINDSGFITDDALPTKVSDLTNDSGFITDDDLPTIPTKTSQLTNDSGFTTSSGRVANIESWNRYQTATYGGDYNIRAVWDGTGYMFKCINPSNDTTHYDVIVDSALHIPWSGVTGAPAFLTEAQVRAIVSEMMG